MQEQLLKSRKVLEDLATHDPLTHIWNRRAILDRLGREAARAEREGKSLAAILVDVDHFKTVNDAQGHLAGDQVLCEVAGRMVGALRPYDMLGRFGGEEFLVVMTSDLPNAAAAVAERLRAAVAATPVRTAGAETCVTVSAGVAAAPPGIAHDPQQLLHAADDALYCAKREGRNRICAALVAVSPTELPAREHGEARSPAASPPFPSR